MKTLVSRFRPEQIRLMFLIVLICWSSSSSQLRSRLLQRPLCQPAIHQRGGRGGAGGRANAGLPDPQF
jgi:hypothetical protein